MPNDRTSLLEYLGVEETDMLVTMVNLHHDVEFFPNLDGVFQAPVPHVDIKVKDFEQLSGEEHQRLTVMTLFLFTHFHHLSTVTMLRCHLSDSLASTRKAIDASA